MSNKIHIQFESIGKIINATMLDGIFCDETCARLVGHGQARGQVMPGHTGYKCNRGHTDYMLRMWDGKIQALPDCQIEAQRRIKNAV